MSPNDPRHGTEAGNEQHHRDGERPCADCREAKLRAARRRYKRKAMGHRYTVPSARVIARLRAWRAAGATYGDIAGHTGVHEGRLWELINTPPQTVYARTAVSVLGADGWPVTSQSLTRRVRALARVGYSNAAIAAAAGVGEDTIADVRREARQFVALHVRAGILTAYQELADTEAPEESLREKRGASRVRRYAEQQGWAAPANWNDIDDLTESPDPGWSHRTRRDCPEYDEVVVERILSGDLALGPYASFTERTEVCRRWFKSGRSMQELRRLTGWPTHRYFNTREDVA